MKSQTATEYLIILAVVIVISLIVIGVLGGIPSIGGGSLKNAKITEIKNRKIGVDSFFVNESYSIDSLAQDVSESISRAYLNDINIDISFNFREAKKRFKRDFLTGLIKKNYGNVSLAAKIANIDRRSIHRIIDENTIKGIRKNMPKVEEIDVITKNKLIEAKSIDWSNKPVGSTVYNNIKSDLSNKIIKFNNYDSTKRIVISFKKSVPKDMKDWLINTKKVIVEVIP